MRNVTTPSGTEEAGGPCQRGPEARGGNRGILGQPLGELGGRLRRAAVVSLPLIAVERPNPLELLRRLDTLGHHLQADAVSERDDGADDRLVRRARGQVPDEAAIDLQL